MNNPIRAFPVLRGLLAKHNMTQDDLALVLGKSVNSVTLKINNKVGWSLSECEIIRDYFRALGEKISADEIFLGCASTIVDNKEIT